MDTDNVTPYVHRAVEDLADGESVEIVAGRLLAWTIAEARAEIRDPSAGYFT